MDANPDSTRGGATKANIFISYSRKDMAFADRLDAALKAHGFEPLIDRTEIYFFEDWWKRIQALISRADTIVFVLSPDAVQSDTCRKEVAFAASLNKRFAPIVCRAVNAADVPAELSRLNFIFFDDTADFASRIETLVEALSTDIEWIRKHTELGELAQRWSETGRPGGTLLRSPLLEDAEHWIAARPATAPMPTDATRALITESRRAATRRRNALTASLGVGLAVAIALAGLAYWQRQTAVANAQIAAANEKTANKQRVENQKSGSRLVAVAAQQLVEEGQTALGQAMALEGLPKDNPPERPIVDETLKALQRAVRADRLIVEFTVPSENVLTAAFTPDGKRLLAATNAGSLVVWNLSTYQKEQQISTQNDGITQINVSPDGKSMLIAGGSHPGVWDIEIGKPLTPLPAVEKGYARTAQFSPDGTMIALGYNTNQAEIRDAKTGALLHLYQGPQDFDAAYKSRSSRGPQNVADPIMAAVAQALWRMWGGMSEVLFSPDGKLLATAGNADAAGATRLFDAASGKLIATLAGDSLTNNYFNQRIAFSPDGALLAAAERDGAMRLWNVADGTLRGEFPHTSDVEAVTFNRSSTFVAAGYHDGSVRIWSTADGRLLSVFTAHIGEVTSLAFSPDEKMLLTSSDDRSIRLWWNTLDPAKCAPQDRRFCDASMRPAATLRGHTDIVQLALFSPDGSKLASVSRDGTVRLWRTRDQGTVSLPDGSTSDAFEEKLQLDGLVDQRLNLAFTPDGKQIIAQNRFRSFTIWRLDDDSVACRLEGFRLSSRNSQGQIGIYRTPFDGRPVNCEKAEDEAAKANDGSPTLDISDYRWLMSPDGSRVVAAKEWIEPGQSSGFVSPSDDEPRRLIDVANRRSLAELSYDNRVAKSLYFSDDGSVVLGLLGADQAGKQKDNDEGVVWNAITGAFLGTTQVWGVQFDITALADSGRQFLLARTGTLTAAHFEVLPGQRLRWQTMSGPYKPLTSATISGDGAVVAVGYTDGTVLLFTGHDGKSFKTLSTSNYAVTKLLFSSDRKLLAGVDGNRTVWLWDTTSGMTLTTIPLKNNTAALIFSPDNDRLAVQTDDAQVQLIATRMDWLGFNEPEDLIDWTRGSLAGSLSASDRERFLLQANSDNKADPALAAVTPMDFPKPVLQPQRVPALKACDTVAANPTDRYRQTEGVVFENLDVTKALAACEAAVQADPNDPIARYQRGRVLERAGRMNEALNDYRAAADAGEAVAIRRIGQLIQFKTPGFDQLGTYESWMERAAAAGDPFGMIDVATRTARDEGTAGATKALRMASAAYNGQTANGALYLALEVDRLGIAQPDIERSYFYLELSQRWVETTPAGGVDAKLRDSVADRLRIVPRQLPPADLVTLYRAARTWRPQ